MLSCTLVQLILLVIFSAFCFSFPVNPNNDYNKKSTAIVQQKLEA